MVQQAVEISAPLHTVYEQLAAFENYPRFMTGVQQVTPIGQDQAHWVMDVEGDRREFDARITERSLDQRVAWAAVGGPRLAETITLRPMGETRTQIVAQLEADVAFLLPSDRHGQETLSKRLKNDLNAFKSLIETGKLGGSAAQLTGASSKNMAHGSLASPASVAARARTGRPDTGAGWGTSAGDFTNARDVLGTTRPNAGTAPLGTPVAGTNVDITSAPGITSAHDLDDVLAPGRRIVGSPTVSGGAAGARSGRQSSAAAPMGGKAMGTRDGRGDGIINEEERGSAHDW
jgi:hypothetical protein